MLLAAALAWAAPLCAEPWIADLPYGAHPRQVMDVHAPPGPVADRPALVMLHGGGWDRGDKSGPAISGDLPVHWTERGYLYVAVNTRLQPEADPALQALDLALAITALQERADDLGLDPASIVVMGHSSGGQVAMLAAAEPLLRTPVPLAGAVALDAGYLDVERFMSRPHHPLFDRAFGSDPDVWAAISPARRVGPGAPPALLVCSVLIMATCADNEAFARAALAGGVEARLLRTELDHMGLLRGLAEESDYARAVTGWIDARASRTAADRLTP